MITRNAMRYSNNIRARWRAIITPIFNASYQDDARARAAKATPASNFASLPREEAIDYCSMLPHFEMRGFRHYAAFFSRSEALGRLFGLIHASDESDDILPLITTLHICRWMTFTDIAACVVYGSQCEASPHRRFRFFHFHRLWWLLHF